MECHHIIPSEKGGTDTDDNCIPLCFDCHADVQHYNDKHPKGTKFFPEELKARRDEWYTVAVNASTSTTTLRARKADRKTLHAFLKALPSNGSVAFVSGHDFAGLFERAQLDDLWKYSLCFGGPEHEFIDQDLEAKRQELLKHIRCFLEEIGRNAFPSTGHHGWSSVPGDWQVEKPTLHAAALRKIHYEADAIENIYNTLVRQARRKLED